ncbi:helix-turn-helix transcriptional regulator [Rhodopseudomonas sp. HC1]|uniref:AraC family transcriptional regulator n=1 Tax=Rhodopseudomonas infernalis TaxID=2897386 RepID=UPI001EE9A036|nr:helix-turn-helix transcriptional regulator [Rhodopseudomonas infernalis]MCG6203486.1 helix-turn-helix transcriptional regulator [Rhodopseudomonas infernalis]
MKQGLAVTDTIAVIVQDGPRYASPWHRHDRAQLLYAKSGVLSVTTADGTWVVPPSRAVWLPAHLEHATASHAGVRFRSLLIEAAGTPGLPDTCRVVEVTPLLRELILKLAALADRGDRKDMAEAVSRVLMMELSFLPTQALGLPLPRHAGLAALCETIRKDLARDMAVEEAASLLHMSRASFMRLFQRETGMSFGRWRQQARMQHALVLLAEGESIVDVAFGCGYDSPSAFSAAFRRTLGRSPSTYFLPEP